MDLLDRLSALDDRVGARLSRRFPRTAAAFDVTAMSDRQLITRSTRSQVAGLVLMLVGFVFFVFGPSLFLGNALMPVGAAAIGHSLAVLRIVADRADAATHDVVRRAERGSS